MYNKRQILISLENHTKLLPINNFREKLMSNSREKSDYNVFINKQIEFLKTRAKAFNFETRPSLTFEKHKLYNETGDRLIFEKEYFQQRKELMTFSLLSFLYPENTDFTKKLENIIWRICSEYSWCLPAHFLDTEDKSIDFELQCCHLDLFSCETGLALCETLEINREHLSPEIISIIESEVKRRILTPFSNPNNFYRFEKMANNWSAVCGGSIGSIAIYLVKDKYELTNILHRSLSCISVYLDSFGNDGVCTEGTSYWTYGFGFFVVFADLLSKKTKGNLNLFNLDKVKNIAFTQQLSYIADNHVISFADGIPTDTYRIGLTSYLQNIYKTIKAPDISYAKNLYDDSCYRYCLSLRDFLWIDEHTTFGLDQNISCYLKDAQWFISKNKSTCVIYKGGHNEESHNHNDVGSFIYYKNGKPILCDLGAGLYDANYFSDKRYETFCTNSKSHNVPVINGHLQQFGEKYKAKSPQYSSTNKYDTFSLELEDCYADETLKRYMRTIHIQKTSTPIITITDNFIFSENGTITENFISLSPIELINNRIVIKNGNVVSYINFDFNHLEVEISETSFTNHFNNLIPVYLLKFTPKENSKDICIVITLS